MRQQLRIVDFHCHHVPAGVETTAARSALPSQRARWEKTAALVSDVTKSINLSLRYELGYDNSLDPEDREDRRFISTMGYKF